MTPKWHQNDIKMTRLWLTRNWRSKSQCHHNDIIMTPKWHQNDTKMTSKWHQNDTKMTPKWHQDDIKMTLQNIIAVFFRIFSCWQNSVQVSWKWPQNDMNGTVPWLMLQWMPHEIILAADNGINKRHKRPFSRLFTLTQASIN